MDCQPSDGMWMHLPSVVGWQKAEGQRYFPASEFTYNICFSAAQQPLQGSKKWQGKQRTIDENRQEAQQISRATPPESGLKKFLLSL